MTVSVVPSVVVISRIHGHQPAPPRPSAHRRIRHVPRSRFPALDNAAPVSAEHVPRVLAHGALGRVAGVGGRWCGTDVGFGEALASAEEEEDECADEGDEGDDADAKAGCAAGGEGFLGGVFGGGGLGARGGGGRDGHDADLAGDGFDAGDG
ncbi:hypothetical protein V493_07674, partial [Pseudogymnoascus sp. VKM F-4281 (FW-2241)]